MDAGAHESAEAVPREPSEAGAQPSGADRMVEELLRLLNVEITWMRNQAGWLSAMSSGLADHAPHCAERLARHADVWSKEAQATMMRAQELRRDHAGADQ